MLFSFCLWPAAYTQSPVENFLIILVPFCVGPHCLQPCLRGALWLPGAVPAASLMLPVNPTGSRVSPTEICPPAACISMSAPFPQSSAAVHAREHPSEVDTACLYICLLAISIRYYSHANNIEYSRQSSVASSPIADVPNGR